MTGRSELRARPPGPRQGGRTGTRGGLPGALRHAAPDRGDTRDPLDNGLIYQSRRFRAACRDYRLRQECITPYTPKQNGMIERFFRGLKEECVWQHLFPSFAAARSEIAAWIRWYNDARPHPALGYRSPREHRAQQGQLVA